MAKIHDSNSSVDHQLERQEIASDEGRGGRRLGSRTHRFDIFVEEIHSVLEPILLDSFRVQREPGSVKKDEEANQNLEDRKDETWRCSQSRRPMQHRNRILHQTPTLRRNDRIRKVLPQVPSEVLNDHRSVSESCGDRILVDVDVGWEFRRREMERWSWFLRMSRDRESDVADGEEEGSTVDGGSDVKDGFEGFAETSSLGVEVRIEGGASGSEGR